MAYVVAEPCIKCRYTDCVEVCPVDCFHAGANFLAIDPQECIDCGACVPVCPTNAIFAEEELPAKWQAYVALNAELAARWPVIDAKEAAFPEAERWKTVEAKQAELDRT